MWDDARLRGWRLALGCFLLFWNVAHAAADTPVEPPLSRAEAEQLLEVLKDPDQRARFTLTLEAYLRAAPLVSAAGSQTAPAASPKPAPATPKPAPSAPKPAPAVSMISRALEGVSDHVGTLGDHMAGAFRALTDWSALRTWVVSNLSNPDVRARSGEATVRLGLIAALVAALELLLSRISRRRRAKLEHPAAPPSIQPAHGSVRLRAAVRHLLGRLGKWLAVAIVGNLLVWYTLAEFPLARSVGFGMLNAYLGVRFFISLVDAVVAPDAPDRRLASLSDPAARQTVRSIRLLAILVAFGFAGGEIATELGASADAHESIQKLIALIVHLVLIVIVIRTRRSVGAWIRHTSAGSPWFATAGEALAFMWPIIAVMAIAAWWLVFAMDVPNGYLRILRFVFATAAILVLSRWLITAILDAIERRFTHLEGSQGFYFRLARYRRLVRAAVHILLAGLTLILLMEAWGLPSLDWFGPGHAAHRWGAVALKIILLGVIGIVCWEAADAAVENRVARLTRSSALARATRLRTLQPIVRVAMIVTLGLLLILTALSEIGINVGPLLAGAGIFGVALGFGSQKLVQDFITGIFLLVEDAVDVGDWVTVAGLSGSVEHLSIRTIRLRAGDGSVHLIPFSAVTSVTNTNRGIGNASVSVNVDPREDTDRVSALLAEIAQEMRKDPAFAPAMQSDLQLWGVDKVDGEMITIVGQIVCTDAGRWAVQREFNRRLKRRLDEEGIALAVPHETVRVERPARKAVEPPRDSP